MAAEPTAVFYVFYKAFVHRILANGHPWYEARLSARTYAVVKWSFNGRAMQTFQKESGDGQLAANNVIDQLTENIRKEAVQPVVPKPKVRVTIYISFSPCVGSFDALTNFKQREDVDVEMMEVIFSSLYNIRRQSCSGDQACIDDHVNRINEAQSDMNKQGLQNMAAANIILRTFSPKDWISFAAALQVSNGFINRLKEDERMAGDLRAILPVADPVEALGVELEDIGLGGNQAGGANQ